LGLAVRDEDQMIGVSAMAGVTYMLDARFRDDHLTVTLRILRLRRHGEAEQ
jgi:hypothetical protein